MQHLNEKDISDLDTSNASESLALLPHPLKKETSPLTLVLTMSLPIAFTMLIANSTKFVEAKFLSNYGEDDLAAVALITTSTAFFVATSVSVMDAL